MMPELDISSIQEFMRRNYQFIIALIIVLIDLAPYYIFGIDTQIGVHDTYDSTVIWYEVLAESGMIFAPNDAIVPGIMNGLPRISFGSEFYAYLWLFFLTDPYTACLINITLGYIIGFAGMYLLLKKHFLTEPNQELIVLGAAVCFAVLQFRPTGGLGLSIATLPLVLYAFLNIRNGSSSKIDWAILLLVPFYASLVYTYFFFLFLVGLQWVVDILRTKTINKKFTGSLLLMGGVFLVIEYRLVTGMLFGSSFVSHRTAFIPEALSLVDALETGVNMFLAGQYHGISLHGVGVLFAIGLAIGLISLYRQKKIQQMLIVVGIVGTIVTAWIVAIWHPTSIIPLVNMAVSLVPPGARLLLLLVGAIGVGVFIVLILRSHLSDSNIPEQDSTLHWKTIKVMITILVICFIIGMWYGIWYWSALLPLKNEIDLLRMFQFHRFYRLFPLLWYILFALALAIIKRGPSFRNIPINQILVLALILMQLSIVMPYNWAVVSRNQGGQDQEVTYREFYAEDLFTQIRDDIGIPQEVYRIINIGIHPAVAQHSGFHTLDGYLNNYPLEYKLQFRNIISYELAKDEDIAIYFDGWGSRCYTFVAELGRDFLCTKSKNLSVGNLELNVTALYEMNCSYVFSAVEILNAGDNNLSLLQTYETAESIWRIYVYELQ
ncbi:MAG: DUF6044 family protein [Candidatus Thorarchaeota archaeon]